MFFEEQASITVLALRKALQTKNVHLANLNYAEGVKCYLMAGLIRWRQGLDPTSVFELAIDHEQLVIEAFPDAIKCAAERLGFLRLLLGRSCQRIETETLTSDRLLDGVLCNWLHHDFDGDRWQQGLTTLKQSGSQLAVETYTGYLELIESPAENRFNAFSKLEGLFEKRKRDKFFAGSDQTEGGGPDNAVTVDYRLGAIAKKLGMTSNSIHSWRWS